MHDVLGNRLLATSSAKGGEEAPPGVSNGSWDQKSKLKADLPRICRTSMLRTLSDCRRPRKSAREREREQESTRIMHIS